MDLQSCIHIYAYKVTYSRFSEWKGHNKYTSGLLCSKFTIHQMCRRITGLLNEPNQSLIGPLIADIRALTKLSGALLRTLYIMTWKSDCVVKVSYIALAINLLFSIPIPPINQTESNSPMAATLTPWWLGMSSISDQEASENKKVLHLRVMAVSLKSWGAKEKSISVPRRRK